MIIISCRKAVEFDFVDEPAQLVVESFICPTDDSIKVNINYTKNYYDQTNVKSQIAKDIPKATVTISNSSFTKTLKWSVKNNAFTIATKEMPLLEDISYTLRITTLNGLIVSGITKIPKKIIGADFEIIKGVIRGDSRKDKIILKQQDEKGVKNYYEFRLALVFEDYYSGMLNQQIQLLGESLIDDESDKLDNVSASFNNTVYNQSNQGQQVPNSRRYYRAIFIKANEEYYKYIDITKKNHDASGNPFAEPVSLYTNIKGGVGVFSSYQIQYKEVNF